MISWHSNYKNLSKYFISFNVSFFRFTYYDTSDSHIILWYMENFWKCVLYSIFNVNSTHRPQAYDFKMYLEKFLYGGTLISIYIEFIDSTGLYYIMFAHNSVVLRNYITPKTTSCWRDLNPRQTVPQANTLRSRPGVLKEGSAEP